VTIHLLKRCVNCATVYAFERGTGRRDDAKRCERITSVTQGEEGIEWSTCKGELEPVNV